MLPKLLTAILFAVSAPLAAATLDVAWWKDGKVQVAQLQQGGTPAPTFDGSREVPLGSLWKLFVYVHALDSRKPMPDYRCTGQSKEEVYCCEAGQSISRDAALAQSCGLFFAPQRLQLAKRPWQQYWSERLGGALNGDLAWLSDPALLTPERLVRLDSLLRVLASIPQASRADAEAALLRVVLDGRGAGTVRWLGSQLRVKTFSWHHPARPKERLGGAAGWLADGTPLWFAGADSSSAILQKWAPRLAAALPPVQTVEDSGCVVVDFFARYPISRVRGEKGAAVPGPLHGRYHIRFDNGQDLAFRSNGEMNMSLDSKGRPHVRGRFGVNEYVARVIDREASAAEPEAAKAFAIAARSYLQQNAQIVAACQQIVDSSATQRVSPNPASSEAQAIARWTDQLIVDGTTVRYHGSQSSPNTLVWKQAVAQARDGRRFDDILSDSYPNTVLSTAGNTGSRCMRLTQNEAWLARALPGWQRILRSEGGYETPAQPPLVCAMTAGSPYSEQSRNRIFMRALATREDRITLAHEFLHLGLRNHPRGQDEYYVEQLARRLIDVNLEGL